MKKILLFSIILALPFLTNAAEYSPLIDIPNNLSGDGNFDNYINSLYIFTITLAGLLAVIKIIVGGVKWMMSDVVTQKAQAIKDIQGALLGLVVVLSAVVILSVINPNLIKIDLSFNQVHTQQANTNPDDVVLDRNLVTSGTYAGINSDFINNNKPYLQKRAFERDCEENNKTVMYLPNGDVACLDLDPRNTRIITRSVLCYDTAGNPDPSCESRPTNDILNSYKSECDTHTNSRFSTDGPLVDTRDDYYFLRTVCLYDY